MFRAQLVSLHESSRATSKAGCAVGATAGLLSAVVAVAAADPMENGFMSVLLTTVSGLTILLIFGALLGAVSGFVIGGIEAAASFAIASLVASRGVSVRSLFTILGGTCAVLNVTVSAIVCIALLGLDGSDFIEYVGPGIVVLATVGMAATLGWSQSLDWPDRAHIDLRTRDVRPRELQTSKEEHHNATVKHKDLVESLQSKLYED